MYKVLVWCVDMYRATLYQPMYMYMHIYIYIMLIWVYIHVYCLALSPNERQHTYMYMYMYCSTILYPTGLHIQFYVQFAISVTISCRIYSFPALYMYLRNLHLITILAAHHIHMYMYIHVAIY